MTGAAASRWFAIAFGASKSPRDAAVVATSGAHLGAAVERACAGRRGAMPLAASVLPAGEIPLGESIGKGVVRLPDAPPAGPVPPPGIVAKLTRGSTTFDGADLGWTRRAAPGTTLVIEAQPAGDQLIEVLMSLVEAQPAIDNIELRIHGHFDLAPDAVAPADELWLSPRLTPKQAVRLLDDHDHEWLRNGHVEVSMYVRAERSTLRLTEHRSIVWIAEQPDTEARITAVLTRAGLAERPTLRTWADVPHLHYRPAGTTPRAGLPKKYTAAQLRKISR